MRAMSCPALLLAVLAAGQASVLKAEIVSEAVQANAQEAAFADDFAAFADEVERAIPTLPGLSAVVVRGDRVIATTNFGMADFENAIPASSATRWYIASSTKAFVGAALARLDRRGEIDLNWTLAELAPDIAFAPELRADEVTIRHLLSHTHGLASGSIEFRLAYSGEHDPETLWGLLGTLAAKEDAPLGTFEYGNLGYNIAAMLIERKLGRRWQDIVDREIIGPLDMHATLTQGLDSARTIAPFAWPYSGNTGESPERLYLVKQDRTMQSAGGLYASTEDMARWLEAQLAAANGRRTDELGLTIASTHPALASLEADFGPFEREGYGLGWYTGDFDGVVLHHAFGSFVGAMAHASFMPEEDLAVAAMTNEDGIGAMAPHILAAFAYDWFLLGPDSARTKGSARLAELSEGVAQERERSSASLQSREGREWQLSLPFSAYAGSYCSAEMGVIRLADTANGFSMEFGELRAEAEPFTSPESLRVELIPGQGMAGRFMIEDRHVSQIELLGEKFVRCN